MRIADNMSFNQIRKNVGENRSQMNDLQNQAATQKRVTKPSDDPIAASRVLSNRIELKGNEQYTKNLNYAQSFLELTDRSLDEVTQHLVRIKELLIAQANDASSSPESRRVVATEIDQLYNQIVKVGNSKLADRFIFGGYKTTKPPFDIHGNYLGDKGELLVGIDKESYLSMNVPGSKVFLGDGLSSQGVTKSAPQQAKSVDELKGQLAVEFAENQPTNGRSPRATPQEAVPNRGPASISSYGMARQTPDSIAAAKKKEEEANFDHRASGINIFNLVKKVTIALKTDDKASVQDSLEKVDDAIQQVVLARSDIGSRSTVLASTLDALSKNKVDTNLQISNLEDADAFQVISDINKTESTLQATLATSGKVVQKSLMDFIS